MKLKKIHKIEVACSKDETRASICQPFIQDGRAIATDGRIMVSAPIETAPHEEIEECKIPIDALKAARKATLKMVPDCELNLTPTSCTVVTGASYPTQHAEARTPRMAEICSAKLYPDDADAAFSVTIDVSLLERLSQSLGSEKVKIVFKDNKSIFTVLPAGEGAVDNGAWGLMMPMRLNR